MPHLVVERLRSLPQLCKLDLPTRKEWPLGVYLVDICDVLASLTFVIGSCCFLPAYSRDMDVFLLGCALFVLGGMVYLLICAFTLSEAVKERGLWSCEAWEHLLYLVGSWIFLVGTILYIPPKNHYVDNIGQLHELTLPQYFNLFEREFEGTVLFIVGSLMFSVAALINALNVRIVFDWSTWMLRAIAWMYMTGSVLFAIGSVFFLPNLGDNEQMHERMEGIGAWCFIVGSLIFLAGGCLSLWRTDVVMRSKDAKGERATLAA